MTPEASTASLDDASLVTRSLAGDRDAFGAIVNRYQSLVCALAYSATGSRGHSEDLAQEVFLAAWRNLGSLQDPTRFRSWLCGVCRNVIHGDLRRLGRQPVHRAAELAAAEPLAANEPMPAAAAISNEEMAILWREVSRLPETLREPLVLYYREHQSVDRVAATLEITPEAAMQRLSRGRRMLQERMLEFVTTTLERTNPGPYFALQVTAALPVLAGAGPAMALGTASKSSAAAKSTGIGTLANLLVPLIGVFAAVGVSWVEIKQAPTPRERRYVVGWMLALWLSVAAFVAGMCGAGWYRARIAPAELRNSPLPHFTVWTGFLFVAVSIVILMARGKAALRRKIVAEGGGNLPPPKLVAWRQLALTAGVLLAIFWTPLFLEWQIGDRVIALGLGAAVLLLGGVATRSPREPEAAARFGGWYVAGCGLLLLGFLNWRLDAWLARVYRVDLSAMHRLLPGSYIHGVSAALVLWALLLLYVTRPRRAA